MLRLKEKSGYFSKSEMTLWCLSVVVCFVAFLVNDIYGYISWQKMQMRQNKNADNPYENSLFL